MDTPSEAVAPGAASAKNDNKIEAAKPRPNSKNPLLAQLRTDGDQQRGTGGGNTPY